MFSATDVGLELVKSKIKTLTEFLDVYLKIANVHTVDFYTEDVWNEFVALPPEAVTSHLLHQQEGSPGADRTGASVWDQTQKLSDVAAYRRVTQDHALPNLGVCTPLDDLRQEMWGDKQKDMFLKTSTFMSSKKSHEVEVMSEVIACIAKYCNIQQDSMMVGLHTCGDLASDTLRIFMAKPELKAVCSVGCCYHLLSEEFELSDDSKDCCHGPWGFPMSQYLRSSVWHCGRNARMSACLPLERVTVGNGLPSESLFYRAVLQVIIKEHYGNGKTYTTLQRTNSKHVGKIYSKSSSFVDYTRKSVEKLGMDGSKMSDSLIQGYYDRYMPRMKELEAFNLLKVALAPCIEGLILLDRLCYLKEQENVAWSALVQLFDPLKSPRCYAVIGVKK
ncbi:methyltransferase-like protein 25 isoform X3 [Scyliorhinus canicula]|uniref:methyltransferase-like protein 25 isoform X3 n=1 Tax=Scyliorhinus canicula TaxID=7830 RepID=UPI0018F7780C|nr:methyltransferase-like protein 25 isoform X3 [Scyliorhinus canicula]